MFSNNSHSNPNGLSPKRKRSHAGLNHLRSQHHPCRCCDPRWSCTGGAERTDSGSASTSHPILLRSQRAVSQGPLARVQQADPHNTIHTHTSSSSTPTPPPHPPPAAAPLPPPFPRDTGAAVIEQNATHTLSSPAWHCHQFTLHHCC